MKNLTLSAFMAACLWTFSAIASSSTPSSMQINEVLNGGDCSKSACTVKVCSVEKKKCSFYSCEAGKRCIMVQSTDMTAEEIEAARAEAEKRS